MSEAEGGGGGVGSIAPDGNKCQVNKAIKKLHLVELQPIVKIKETRRD